MRFTFVLLVFLFGLPASALSWCYEEQVESSWIESLGFCADEDDPEIGIVEMNTVAGAGYRYFEVPEDVFWEWLLAPSRGSYFNSNVRDYYDFLRLY